MRVNPVHRMDARQNPLIGGVAVIDNRPDMVCDQQSRL